jgi:hypothetical protein
MLDDKNDTIADLKKNLEDAKRNENTAVDDLERFNK